MTWLIEAFTKVWDSITGFIENAITTAKQIGQIVEVVKEAPGKLSEWGSLLPPALLTMLLLSLAFIVIFAVLKLAGFGGERD